MYLLLKINLATMLSGDYMINLYCEFKGSNRRILKEFKKQLNCSHIIATEEYTFGKRNDPSEISNILNEYADKAGYETKVLSGKLINCDFFLPDVPEVLKSTLEREYTLAKSRYLLVHLYKTPSFFNELVSEMGRLGIVMIQLHHLKHGEYIETLGLLHMLDAKDICGKNGSKAQNKAFEMIKDGIVSFVGGCNITDAYNIVVDNFSRDTAYNLFVNNPSKVILDESIY